MAGLAPNVRQQILDRGYSSTELDQWLKDNPNDEGRALSAFSAKAVGGGAGATGPAVGGAAPAATPPSPSMDALNRVADVQSGGGGQVAAMQGGFPRQGLGRRIFPQESSALAGLRKVY